MPPNRGPGELLTSRLSRIDLFMATVQGGSGPGIVNDAGQKENKRKIEHSFLSSDLGERQTLLKMSPYLQRSAGEWESILDQS